MLPTTPSGFRPEHPFESFVSNMLTCLILYGFLVPISLYVSVEIVKVVQATLLMNKDQTM